LDEATAPAVLFLDDDVEVAPDTVLRYAWAMAVSEFDACGLVGRVVFPPSPDPWHQATRLSGITLAFDWPDGAFGASEVVPWGVTASLCVWRRFAVDFDVDYAKTGGGEDVDFCLRVAQRAGRPWARARDAVARHPFWHRDPTVDGTIKYLAHFFKWTQGDGLLLDKFPEHVYLNLPNVVELTIPVVLLLGLRALVALWLVELACEARAVWTDERPVAALLSGVVKNVVDAGHAWYWIRRGRAGMLCSRFDWFCGVTDAVVVGERRKFAQRCLLWAVALWASR